MSGYSSAALNISKAQAWQANNYDLKHQGTELLVGPQNGNYTGTFNYKIFPILI